ncbi:MAG: hypothetical protein M5R41_16535 [Bacteroidia bacterium]|nr:hypothetical protein [Bacteroidia bacterium]
MKTAEHLQCIHFLLTTIALSFLQTFVAQPLTAQPLHCTIEADKYNYIQDDRALVVLRIENPTEEKMNLRFVPVRGSDRFLSVMNKESGDIFTLLETGQGPMRIGSNSVYYITRRVDLLLYDADTGNSGLIPPGDWYLRFDMIITTDSGAEYELPLRALIHVNALPEGGTTGNKLRAAEQLVRERRRSRSEEYELPAEFQDLMNGQNETPYRNGVIGYYYSHILSSVGREIAMKQGRLYENRVEYIERLLRHFAAWPDEVQSVYVWDMTIGLMVKSPPDICERALAIPGIENTRLGRYLREYACRESAAEKGGK